MQKEPIKILAISGSLRASSSNNIILRIIASMVPAGIDFTIYQGLAAIPAFDDSEHVPEPVIDFREKVSAADAVLICTPEYAFGVPGALKNALDWTVGSGEFINKPVALITASSVGKNAHAALLLTLGAISAIIPEGASLLIPFIRAKLNEQGEIKDEETSLEIKNVLDNLIKYLNKEN